MEIFGYCMAGIYVVLGILCMMLKNFDYWPKNIRMIFGMFFVAYGLFRFIRIYYKNKEEKRNLEENV